MKDQNGTHLSAEELEALRTLPRQQRPGDLLEERTVQALHERGLLGARRRGRAFGRGPLLVSGVAAAVALFVSGLAVGQWVGTRSVTEVARAFQQDNALEAAALVQQAGSAYVTALMELVQLADSSSGPAIAQGREAALTALFAAATEVVRMAPNDPQAVTLHQLLARWREPDAGDRVRNVMWF